MPDRPARVKKPGYHATRMGRWTRAAAWSPWLWGGALLAAARWPAAREAVPCLRLAAGPLGVVVLALAAAVSIARRWSGTAIARRGPSPRALFLVAFGVSSLVGLRYVGRLTASGDEPHYLLMAQSLWKEGDLDLRDNIERGDYREYFPGDLVPHWGAPRRDGRPFPAHSPGLPVLLAPVYALGGRRACVVLFALLLAALGHEVLSLARRLTRDDHAALTAWAVAVGPPAFVYSFHLYTELPSALAAVVALRLLLASPGVGGAVAAAASVAVLPWLHLKMIPAAAVLGLVGLLRLRGRPLVAFAATAAIAATGFLGYYQATFGTPTPLALYGGGVPPGTGTSALRAAAGLLLDRSFGLLPHAPVFLVAFAGLPFLGRWRRRDAVVILAVAAAVVAPLLNWRMWWGGQCPPGRFLVPVAPLLALLVAARVAGDPRGLARWRWALLSLGLGLALFMAATPEALRMLNRGDRPTRVWAALSGERPAGIYLPSLVADAPDDRRVAVVWAGALTLLLALDVASRRHGRVDGLFRGLGLPVLLALAVGVAVDFWARPGERPPAGPRVSWTGGAASPSCPS
jgi:hypothetical protein